MSGRVRFGLWSRHILLAHRDLAREERQMKRERRGDSEGVIEIARPRRKWARSVVRFSRFDRESRRGVAGVEPLLRGAFGGSGAENQRVGEKSTTAPAEARKDAEHS
jgi:hypothetical protein